MPADTQTKIGWFLNRAKAKGVHTDKMELYSRGLIAKLRQAHFSLQILKELEHLETPPISTDGTQLPTAEYSLTVEEKISLYCDCFWDFLRSALDIMAQLVNECESLNIIETGVDLKKVAQKISLTQRGSKLDKALNVIC
jgi:hypothetical protein